LIQRHGRDLGAPSARAAFGGISYQPDATQGGAEPSGGMRLRDQR
jgi:hypothetical protein